jgi:hypothetical protein
VRVGCRLRQHGIQAIIEPHRLHPLPSRPVDAPFTWCTVLRKRLMLNYPEMAQA